MQRFATAKLTRDDWEMMFDFGSDQCFQLLKSDNSFSGKIYPSKPRRQDFVLPRVFVLGIALKIRKNQLVHSRDQEVRDSTRIIRVPCQKRRHL